jgi:hypothetical protein
MDDNREIKGMIFSAIHIPPLPALVNRVDRDYLVIDDAVESSHSIIGGMLDWTALTSNASANNNRLMLQEKLFSQFKKDLANLDLNCPIEDLYNFYCHHTRMWIGSYTSYQIWFKPLDYVLKNDKIHQNMRGYTKAQYHIFTENELKLDESVLYPQLLLQCAQMTKEFNNT